MTHQLTIRYDEILARKIDDLARREGVSRNQAVLRLLRRGAGIERGGGQQEMIGDSLDWFVGSWTEEEAREFDEAVADFGKVDEALWR